MRKQTWSAAFNRLCKCALVSFGMALCLFMIVSMGSLLVTGNQGFGPGEARIVFAAAFGISLICFAALTVRCVRSDSSEDEADAKLRQVDASRVSSREAERGAVGDAAV